MLREVIKEIGLFPETIQAAIQDETYWKLEAEAIFSDYEHSVENYTSIASNIVRSNILHHGSIDRHSPSMCKSSSASDLLNAKGQPANDLPH